MNSICLAWSRTSSGTSVGLCHFDALSDFVVSSDSSGRRDKPDPLPDISGRSAPAGPITVGAVEGDLQYRVVLTRMPDGGSQAVAISLKDVDATVRTATGTVVASCLLAVLLAGGIVWLTVRRGLRPTDLPPWLLWTAGAWMAWKNDPVQGYYTDYVGWWSALGLPVLARMIGRSLQPSDL